MQSFFLKIRRKETPFYEFLHGILSRAMKISIPAFFVPFYRIVYQIRTGTIAVIRRMGVFFYYEPMFRSQCKKVGKRLQYVKLRQGFPYFYGNLHIYMGDNVTVHSRATFSAGKIFNAPTFRVGNNTYLGPGLSVGVAKEVSIGSFCHIGSNVVLTDNDGHPLDPIRRTNNEPVEIKDISPVLLENNVWVGEGATVLKGVTIGKSSIVASRSVVVRSIEPFSIVAGNPARVIKKIT